MYLKMNCFTFNIFIHHYDQVGPQFSDRSFV